MSENIESWYRYANGPRGRELANGDLRLVIGCDKTTAWGMAAFANHTVTQLHFRSVGHSENTPCIKTYGWDLRSGTAEARSGPDMREIQALSAGDADQTGNPRPYENQCIFVRTLNTTLNNAEWLRLMAEVKVSDDSGSHTTSQCGSNHSTQDGAISQDLGCETGACVASNPSSSDDKTSTPPTKRELAEIPAYVVRRRNCMGCSAHR